jgi:hypothetical protein
MKEYHLYNAECNSIYVAQCLDERIRAEDINADSSNHSCYENYFAAEIAAANKKLKELEHRALMLCMAATFLRGANSGRAGLIEEDHKADQDFIDGLRKCVCDMQIAQEYLGGAYHNACMPFKTGREVHAIEAQ